MYNCDRVRASAFAAAALCSGVKSGSGCDFILNIGLPLGISKLAQFRTFPRMARPTSCPSRRRRGGEGLEVEPSAFSHLYRTYEAAM